MYELQKRHCHTQGSRAITKYNARSWNKFQAMAWIRSLRSLQIALTIDYGCGRSEYSIRNERRARLWVISKHHTHSNHDKYGIRHTSQLDFNPLGADSQLMLGWAWVTTSASCLIMRLEQWSSLKQWVKLSQKMKEKKKENGINTLCLSKMGTLKGYAFSKNLDGPEPARSGFWPSNTSWLVTNRSALDLICYRDNPLNHLNQFGLLCNSSNVLKRATA